MVPIFSEHTLSRYIWKKKITSFVMVTTCTVIHRYRHMEATFRGNPKAIASRCNGLSMY